ncbi:hypothetical protein GCK32_013128 [Trichostrongylus colubriformis]|uniref:DUF7774 domain-containing protein n=1 Tax=Trichostrongylus colubriformis TaxID=6319 RepID=A0AAN8G0L5_TRICO
MESKKKEKEKLFDKTEEIKTDQGIQTTKEFQAACKIMSYAKQKRILEQVLTDENNQLIREFFEHGLENPSEQVNAKI